MTPFYNLLKREWLEHKAPFIWVPLVVSIVIIIVALVFQAGSSEMIIKTNQESHEVIDGVVHTTTENREVSLGELLAGGDEQPKATDVRDYFYVPLLIIVLFGLLSSTQDERKDGSILFFKSMPVSDTKTIISKYTFMAWLAPLPTLACLLLVQLALATWSSYHPGQWPQFAGQGVAEFTQFAANTLVSYVLFGLWALPVFAWTLLVGAWADRAAVLWAIGVPFGISIIESMVNNSEVFQNALLRHLSPTLLVDLSGPNAGSQLLAKVMGLDLWLGLLVGIGLLALAIYCRRTRNEI